MIQLQKKENCTGCYACANACPKNCLTLHSDSEGFWYPKIDESACVDCGLCEKTCPIITPLSKVHSTPNAYAAYNKDETIRLASSSGGIFTLIAEIIIVEGGVVYGAAFDAHFDIVHVEVNTAHDLENLRGSKYVQSRIGDIYQQAKRNLDAGKPVLFTGTPCQIGGLRAYLGKDYEQLICQDIICHGVPSPLVWEKYVAYRKKTITSPVRRIAFRRKNEGWKRFSVSFSSEKNTEYRKNLSEDSFMQGFLANLYLRPSCYACHYKTLNRQSDLTLADFWGIENVLPEMDDDRGTSLVLIHSPKGQVLFEQIKENMVYQKVPLEVVETYNSAAVKSCAYTDKRDQFFESFQQEDFEKLVMRLTRPSLSVRLKIKIVQILDKLGLKKGVKKLLKR